MVIEKNVYLAPFTTFGIGGVANYFCRVKNTEELKEAILFSKERNLRFFVLGGGSNILVSDHGFDGLVIKIDFKGRSFENLNNKKVRMLVASGEVWDQVVEDAVSKGLYGIENLSNIPGSVGATPIQNIGAYGMEISQSIAWVEVFDTQTMEVKNIYNEDCQFSYRNSIFKTNIGKKYIVLKVVYDLKKEGLLKMEYRGISDYFKENFVSDINLSTIRKAIIYIRKTKLPNINLFGNAGSFFKNPIISKEKSKQLRFLFPDIPLYPYNTSYNKTSAAWLLDKVGNYNGLFRKNVGVYEKQPIVLISNKDGKANDIVELAEEIILDLKNKTGIILELEINKIGKFKI